jgi:hypothetical protein
VIDNVNLFYVPGTALATRGTTIAPGTQLSAHEANHIRDISIKRAYRGMKIDGGVNLIENIDVTEVRDYGMRLDNGVNQLENIHTYAGDVGVWASSGQTRGNLLYVEQSPVGLKIDASNSSFSQLFSHTNPIVNVEINGASNRLSDFNIDVMANAAGVRIGAGNGSGASAALDNGVIFLASNTVGVRLAANGAKILNAAIHGHDGATNRVGIRAESVINDSVIVADFSNIELGLDLNYGGISQIGKNNAVWLTGYQVGQVANLPAAWDASNKIYVNGVLQSGGNVYGAKATAEGIAQIIAASAQSSDLEAVAELRPLLPNVTAPPINDIPNIEPPTGSLMVAAGTTSLDQYVLPTFADGSDAPAGQLIGEGAAESRLAATVNTQYQPIPAIVMTEHYGEDMSEWYNGTFGHPEYASSVLYAHVRDVTIAGYDDTSGNYGSGGAVGLNPQLSDAGKADLYHGLLLQGNGTVVSDVNLVYIPGTAIVSSRPSNPRFDQSNPMDRTKPILRDVSIERAYRGMHLLNVDQFVNNLSVGWVRDYGVKLENSAAQLQHIHTYGSGAIGVWAASGPNWGNDLVLEDTTIGLKIDAHTTAFAGVVSRNHSDSNIELTGASNIISDFQLDVSPGAVGFEISGHLNGIDGGTIELSGSSGHPPDGIRKLSLEGD